MAKDTSIFLTPAQAVKAICEDFSQYEPQLLLFCEILPIISDGKFHLKREPDRTGAWVNTGAHGRMRWLEGPDLVAYMCTTINNAPFRLPELVTICARVFQSHAEAGLSTEENIRGVYIDTGMADYHCRQCGRCCRILDYQDEITAEDVQRWHTMDRKDILEWVGVYKEGGQTSYRIWVKPDNGQLATQCPFLKQHNSKNRWSCRIHSIKPAICRNYPMSRKHGLMTGCLGFQKSTTD